MTVSRDISAARRCHIDNLEIGEDGMKTGRFMCVCVAAAWLLQPGAAAAETLVVLNKAEATASLIDLSSGAVVETLPTGTGPHEAATSPDGAFVLATNYGTRDEPGSTLTLIDVAEAAVVRTIDLAPYHRPHGVRWLADGRRAVVTAESNKALLIVDVHDGTVLDAIDTDQQVSHMVAVTPDGGRAFVANIGSGSVTAIDLVEGRRISNFVTGAGAEGIDVTPDGREVWVTNRAADTISVVDAESLEIKRTLDSPDFPIRATVSPDGSYVLVSHARSADVGVFDADTGELLRRISMQKDEIDLGGKLFGDLFGDSSIPIGVQVEPSGKRAWVALAGADLIAEVVMGDWTVSRALTAGREPDGMAYSPLQVRK
jgi:YVTN family beta-propeller protein